MNKFSVIFFILLLVSCKTNQNFLSKPTNEPDQLKEYFDSGRSRKIPVAIFSKKLSETKKKGIIIFSHGYGRNDLKSYLTYNYLLGNLAKQGYFVVSIQHELTTDDLLPLEGNPQILRRPNWERGAENIRFVLQQLKKDFPHLNYNRVVVAGHSNGGDMSVLFADKYPELIWKLITLDQRRYAFPRISKPKIYSLRSSDQPADDGVLPTEEEQKRFGMTIIKLKNTIHNDMDDGGTESQKAEIFTGFLNFLKEN